MDFFNDIDISFLQTKRGVIRYRKAGIGPPLLMLHGNPQTHVMWHKVVPSLVDNYTVICPDIPGYGKSFKPKLSEKHEEYSKVNMAKDINEFMSLLKFNSFYLIAHDRGARIAHRLALDFPDKILKMILLDIIPTIEHFERANMDFAMGYYHWFWLAQRNPIPESVPKSICNLCYTAEELITAINKLCFESTDFDKNYSRVSIGKQIRHDYFESVNGKSVLAFLNL